MPELIALAVELLKLLRAGDTARAAKKAKAISQGLALKATARSVSKATKP